MAATLNLKQYFVAINGSQHGPLSADQIQAKISAKEIDESYLVWTEGMENWDKLGNVAALSIRAPSAPPPLKPPQFDAPTPPNQPASTIANTVSPLPNELLQTGRSEIRTGIPKYDNEIFPKLMKGENSFNWHAFFFSGFWMAYKGMWGSFKTWMVPYAIVYGTVYGLSGGTTSPKMQSILGFVTILLFPVTIFWAYSIGKSANKLYFDHMIANPQQKDSASRAAGGFGIYLAIYLTAFGVMFALGKASSGSRSVASVAQASQSDEQRDGQEETQSQQQAQSSQPATAPAIDYTNSSLAVMDGQAAIGKTIAFRGLFLGLQTIQDQPVLMVSDVSAGSMWLITFTPEYRQKISQLRTTEQYNFQCKILSLGGVGNICLMN